jgi:hypothetical protein
VFPLDLFAFFLIDSIAQSTKKLAMFCPALLYCPVQLSYLLELPSCAWSDNCRLLHSLYSNLFQLQRNSMLALNQDRNLVFL